MTDINRPDNPVYGRVRKCYSKTDWGTRVWRVEVPADDGDGWLRSGRRSAESGKRSGRSRVESGQGKARRAESDPMVVFASALTQAFATLAERSPGGPVTKTVERDESGNIVRIIESPQ